MKGSPENGDIDVEVSSPAPPPTTTKPPKLKSIGDAYVLCFPLGILGIHHFYLRSPGLGLAYMFTLGCGGIGWLVDWFRMPMLVRDANRKIEREWKIQNEETTFTDEDAIKYELDTKRLSDCYVLGFVTGLLGLHHFYLRRTGWGVLYLFTLGLMGCGLLMDWFRMPVLYKRYKTNLKLKADGKHDGFPEERHLDDAYALGFPLGLLGFHHFYLKRPCWGILYMFTFGMLGLGFLIDLIRMKSLVDDANRRIRAKAERQRLVASSHAAVYTTNQETVSYMITPPARSPEDTPGATAGSYQAPGATAGSYQAPYGYPYPNQTTQQGFTPHQHPPQQPYPNHVPHPSSLPQGAYANPPMPHQQPYPQPPPPYSPSAEPGSSMQDPDGIPVEKPGLIPETSVQDPDGIPVEKPSTSPSTSDKQNLL